MSPADVTSNEELVTSALESLDKVLELAFNDIREALSNIDSEVSMVLDGKKADVGGNGQIISSVLESAEKALVSSFANISEALQTVGRATTMFLGALVGGL